MNFQTKGLLITTLGVLLIVPDSLFVRLIDASGTAIVFWCAFRTHPPSDSDLIRPPIPI